MRISRIFALAGLPFALIACAEEEPEVAVEEEPVMEEVVPVTPTAEPAAEGMQASVAMQPVGNSGVTGEATLQQAATAGQTEVMVTLNATGADGTHQGHIHQGTCESPGSVVTPLQPITVTNGTGSMTTTVQLDPMAVMDGNHIVVYHAAGGSPGQPVVCGAIPGHTM